MIYFDSKKSYEELFLKLMKPLVSHYSEGGARLRLGVTGVCYHAPAAELEAFSRPLWGLVSYLAGKKRDLGETQFREIYLKHNNHSKEESAYESNEVVLTRKLIAIYQKGLASGTDPDNPEYWGDCGTRDQCFVEMAAIGYALFALPEVFWKPLRDDEKEHLAKWLYQINLHEIPPTNWYFFLIYVNAGLRRVGAPFDADAMDRALESIESYYAGDGWYTDGIGGNIDFYNVWAFHDMGLLYARYCGDIDPERAERFKERAILFGRQYANFFDTNGAAAVFGRSLTYRFALVSFWSACLVAGVKPIPANQMKRIIDSNLNWWFERPILDRCGILTIGYAYPQMEMTEIYNGPGSPYWAMKAFYLLSLGADDEFFSQGRADYEDDDSTSSTTVALQTPGIIVQKYDNGRVSIYPKGVTHYQEHGQGRCKYGKFVYDSRFGFSVSRGNDALDLIAPDSTLCFEVNGYYYQRGAVLDSSIEDDEHTLVSVWEPLAGIHVETRIALTENGHIRHHVITADYPCKAIDCGFAVPAFEPDSRRSEDGSSAMASAGDLSCKVAGSYLANRENSSHTIPKGIVIGAAPNTSLMFQNTVIPAVVYDIPAGTSEIETCFE